MADSNSAPTPIQTGITRRGFLTASAAAAFTAASHRRAYGANERIRVGVIGCGGRGTQLIHELSFKAKRGMNIEIAAISDVYEGHKTRAKDLTGADVHHEWGDLVARDDIDAVFVATPDHWHAPMAMAAMDAGKDVYCEKPMTHTIEEAKRLRDKTRETGRTLQVGVQRSSEGQWHTARKLIQEGLIGPVVWCQDSYSRNSRDGEWNYAIADDASAKTIDWNAFLGNAPQRPFSPERFFRWRKYWDYSGGIATDLHYHKLAALQVALTPQVPKRVSAAGGIYIHDDREVPDTFMMTAEYDGYALVIASSMANSGGMATVIRGHEASIEFVSGDLEIQPEIVYRDTFRMVRGSDEPYTIEPDERPDHITNFFECMRSRETCVMNEESAYRAMVAIGMSVEAYRTGATLYYDAVNEAVTDSPPRPVHANPRETA